MAADLTPKDLARVLGDAIIFASRDTDLPMINAVRLESSPRHLIAVATDRMTLGCSHTAYVDGAKGPAFAFTLRLPHAQLVVKVAKAIRGDQETVRLSVRNDVLTFAFTTGERLSFPPAAGNAFIKSFPEWRKLVSPPEQYDPVAHIAVNPSLLARFNRVGGAQKMVCLFAGPNKPIRVSIGEHFFGLCMPMRAEDTGAGALPEWLATPTGEDTAAKAAS